MPKIGSDFDLSAGTKAIPVTHVARDAGYNPHWTNGGNELR